MSTYLGRFITFSILITCLYSVDVFSYAEFGSNQPVTIRNILTTSPDEDLSDTMESGGKLTITISGGGSATIRFLQAVFYSNITCSTPMGAGSIIDNVDGRTFTNGQTISINKNSTYQLASNQGINTANIRCMRLYVDGSNQSSNGVSCQNFSDEICTGTACSSVQTRFTPWITLPTTCISRRAYIANSTGDSGNLGSVRRCDINTSTGALTCPFPAVTGFNSPAGVSMNNGFGYVTNSGNNTISLCTVNYLSGALTCNSTTSTGTVPGQITISSKYIYFTNITDGTLTKCTTSPSSSSLSSCSTVASLTNPHGIAINNGYAYISSGTGNSVSLYTVTPSTGTLAFSANTGSGFNAPRGIAISNGFLYVANSGNNTVSKCTVNAANGTLSACSTTGSGFSGPRSVAITNGFAYITNLTGNTVSKCTVTPGSGLLSSCAATGSGFSSPVQIAIF